MEHKAKIDDFFSRYEILQKQIVFKYSDFLELVSYCNELEAELRKVKSELHTLRWEQA